MPQPPTNSAKVPPQDPDAEKSVLGAVLKTDDVMANISTILQAEDFYEPRHQLIYAAMFTLYEQSKPVDLLTLTTKLRQQKNLDKAGGSSYLAELTNYVPTAAHAEAYADIVARCALRRRLIRAAGEIASQAYDEDGEIQAIVDAAEKELFQAADQNTKNDIVALSDILIDTFDRIEELQNNKGALRGLKTGFHDLDHKTAGFQKSDLIIIGARPAMGKTTLAQNLIYNVASINKKPVLFFSLEMSREQIVDRMIADVAGVDSWKIRTGNLSGDDYKKIAEATDEMSEAPIFIDDNSGTNILELRTKARRAHHDHGISMIVVDYLQLLSGSAATVRTGNRVQEVSEISRGLKLIARELNIPVIALAQLSRNVTGRDDPRPVLSDLRESGSIEQDADLVMFIHRPDYYKQNDDTYEPTHITELLIAKHRNGPIGKIELYFDPEHLRFMSLDKEHRE
jgi:replicative DNA helicase